MIKLTADKVKVNGPRVDGTWTVTFECGEYMNKQVAELIKIPQGKLLSVIIQHGQIQQEETKGNTVPTKRGSNRT